MQTLMVKYSTCKTKIANTAKPFHKSNEQIFVKMHFCETKDWNRIKVRSLTTSYENNSTQAKILMKSY